MFRFPPMALARDAIAGPMLAGCVFLGATLAGCAPSEPQGNAAAFDASGVGDVNMPSPAVASPGNAVAARPVTLAPLEPPPPGTKGGLPDDREPLIEGPFPEDSAQAAGDVVQRYYGYLATRDYNRAFALWDENGARSGMNAADFAASFAKYSEYHANVGRPGIIDSGAGQRYVAVPVQPYARLKANGAPVYLIGTIMLHRTGVDGASADQRRWHIQKITLTPVTR